MEIEKSAKKRIIELQRIAKTMELEIVSLRVPQKYLGRGELEPTYPEKFLGINICEHKNFLHPQREER